MCRVTALLALLLATACSSSTVSPSSSPTPDASASAEDEDAGAGAEEDAGTGKTHAVVATGHSYVPAKLTIKAGDTVEWSFQRGTHTVTEGTDCTPKSGGFDSGTHASPFKFRRTFTAPGTTSYFCDFRDHCSMGQVGTVVVEP